MAASLPRAWAADLRPGHDRRRPYPFQPGQRRHPRSQPDAPGARAQALEAKLAVLADPTFRAELHEFKSIVFNTFPEMRLHRTHERTVRWRMPACASAISPTISAAARSMCCATLRSKIGSQAVFETQQFQASLAGLKELVDEPYLIPGLSDGGAHLNFLTSGCYGTEYLARFVRDESITSLEQAHWRLSGLPAHCAGIPRPWHACREGAAADIIVYDLRPLAYGDTEFVHDLPAGQMRAIVGASGYHYTFVNGQLTIDHDNQTDTMAGRLLRHGRS